VQYQFRPGQPFQFDLAVSNGGAAPLVVQTSVTDLWYNEKNEKVFDPPGTSPHSAANWIEVVPPQITLPGGGTGKVNVVVTPPTQVSGGYYAVIFLESKPELAQAATEDRKAVYTNIRLGSLILLSAANTEDYKIEVADAQLTPADPNHTLKVDFQLWNKSNTHIFAETKLAIINARRDLVAKAEAETRRFLPQQRDRVSASWAGNLPPGAYTAILTVLYGPDKIYTADLPFTVAESQLVESSQNQ
jgi:hypothetical protein